MTKFDAIWFHDVGKNVNDRIIISTSKTHIPFDLATSPLDIYPTDVFTQRLKISCAGIIAIFVAITK
jgi:hypothetical protein